MKRILSLFVILGLYLSTSAQVIELQGIGMVDKVSETLTFTDPGSITKATVFAMYKASPINSLPDLPDGTVEFSDANEFSDDPYLTSVVDMNFTSANPFLAYWTADFASVDAGGITATVTETADEPFIPSYYAYVYRDIPNANYISYANTEIVFYYRNGENNPYVYNIPIAPGPTSRDITINIPISELANDDRNVVIDITAGSVQLHAEETTWNIGESFFLGTYLLEDVPFDVENITVSIYSPATVPFYLGGDSFFTGGVVADVHIDGDGCTLTQGYWKTHSKGKKYDPTWDFVGGPDADFFSSGQSFIEVMKTPVKGNAYYILAHQYIAALLNFYNGANPLAAFSAYSDATVLFETYDPDDIKPLKGNNPIRQQFVNLGGILADYNEGDIGPGHCDDKSTYAEIETSNGSEMNIYPNPMTNSGIIDFTVVYDAQTTVEMYNLMGQKVATLFDQPAQADQKYQVRIDANRYEKGLYVISLRNGSNTVTSKININ